MSGPRLYAVEIGGTIVTVRAEVVYPSREDRDTGADVTWVDFEAVNGVRAHRLLLITGEEWDELSAAVIAADAEYQAKDREAAQ